MFDQIRGYLERVARLADAQQQREAMVDLLIWTMYADNVLTLPENDRIDDVTEQMKWESPTPPSQYLNVSIAKIRDALGDEDKAGELLDNIDRRLRTSDMKREAYEACRDLAKADGQVADKEMELLNTIKQHFKIAT